MLNISNHLEKAQSVDTDTVTVQIDAGIKKVLK